MNDEEALKAGWQSGDAADFPGMTEAERQELDVHVSLIRAVRRRRDELGLTQKQLADRRKISKRIVERMEGGGGEITLEQILHAYVEMGGRLAITELPPHPENGGHKRRKNRTPRLIGNIFSHAGLQTTKTVRPSA